MNIDIEDLSEQLCRAMCARVTLHPTNEGHIRVSTPFTFPDGDLFALYLKPLPTGGYRLSDMGSTLMHLSYEHDVEKLREGTRGKVFGQILTEMGVSDAEGEIFLEVPAFGLAGGVFQFGQALTRIHDLNFLSRVQVEKTFYDDLKLNITEIVGEDRVLVDFVAPNVPNAEEYAADFCIQTDRIPLLIWGVPNQTKARLATIVIQHLKQHSFRFRSMVVYSDMAAIPRADVSRLTTAANDQISSLAEREALRTKINDVLAA